MRASLHFLICLSLLVISGQATAQDAVPWARSLEEAQQIAGQRGQLILLHFYGDNCPPCRALESNVFPKPEFARGLTANYVPVKINASQNRQLAARYGVDRWPVDVVVTADGTPLTKPAISPQDSNKFLANLDQIAALHRVRMDPSAQVAQNVAYNQPPSTSQYAPQSAAPTPGYGAATTLATSPNPAPMGDPRQANMAPPMQSQSSEYDPRGYQSQGMQANPVDRRSNFPVAAAPPGGMPADQGRSVYPGVNNQFPAGENPRGMQSESSNAVYGKATAGYAPAGEPRRDVQLGDSRYTPGGPAPVMQPGVGAIPPGQSNEFTGHHGAPQPNAAVAPTRNDAPSMPSGNPPMALEGYCPVALTEAAKWTKGDVRFGAIHRGRTYLFATQADQQRFMANPDKYSPMLSGFDAVKYIEQGVLVDGKRQHGIVHEGQMYLFADETALDRFCKSPNSYCNPVRQAMQQSVTPTKYR